MKVKFLGVGEAFDDLLPNVSVWVRSEGANGAAGSALLDCGFTAPPQFWQNCPDPDALDLIWISHFHGDHYFGIPALLTRFWESGRKKPLLILGQEGVGEKVPAAINLAFPSFMEKFAFELQFREVEPGRPVEAAGFSFSTAVNGHTYRDLAVRVEAGGRSLFYSGDGQGTDQTLALAKGCDLVIHEAYRLDRSVAGHGSIPGAVDFARRAGARSVAVVHIQRNERRERRKDILRLLEDTKDIRAFMPEPGEEIDLDA